jgi:hypothetical protein
MTCGPHLSGHTKEREEAILSGTALGVPLNNGEILT